MIVEIDGASGEGGGQILRTSLALAAATGTPVRVSNVRANRPNPGLRPQHLAAARALASLTEGRVHGLALGSPTLTFEPGLLVGGAHAFHVDTAGAMTLVLQAVLPACAASRQAFSFELTGGTDVPFAPTWDHTAHVHAPLLRRLGVDVEAVVERRGYFPAGGGRATVTVDAGAFAPADLTERGRVRDVRGHAHCHGIPRAVAERGAETLRDRLVTAGYPCEVTVEQHRGPGTGFALAAWAACERSVLGSDGVGERGVRAELVATRAAQSLVLDLASGASVDVHEADALPVYLALAGGGAFTVRSLSSHARTTLDLLPRFLPVETETSTLPSGLVRVAVRPSPA